MGMSASNQSAATSASGMTVTTGDVVQNTSSGVSVWMIVGVIGAIASVVGLYWLIKKKK